MIAFLRTVVIRHHSEGTNMMNTLPKSLTIAFLAISVLISGPNVDPVCAQDTAEAPVSFRRPADLLLSRYLKFGRLTAEDGLSNDQVWGVVQDNDGFMWFATVDGLNRYDGAGFKIYHHNPGDPNSLSQSYLRSLLVDQRGALWIGTRSSGLNLYDREKDLFIRYRHDPDPAGRRQGSW